MLCCSFLAQLWTLGHVRYCYRSIPRTILFRSLTYWLMGQSSLLHYNLMIIAISHSIFNIEALHWDLVLAISTLTLTHIWRSLVKIFDSIGARFVVIWYRRFYICQTMHLMQEFHYKSGYSNHIQGQQSEVLCWNTLCPCSSLSRQGIGIQMYWPPIDRHSKCIDHQ